ncbi:MAG: PAS domain-containing protein, partial [Anaerolineales bacterium]
NEELQSTNEELETSKEETQSINEELVTVNTELQEKVKQLTQANDDLNNLMAVTGIGTIFVDMNMCITRYTPAVTDIVNLIEGDRGRPLGNITSNLRYENLLEDVQQVLDTLHSKEIEAQSKDDKWYLIRLLPYRTLENVIQGVVITFVDITAQKMIEEEMQKLSKENEDSRLFIENVLDTVREALVVLDSELRVVSVNRSFYDTFQVKPNQTVGKLLYNLGNQQWDIPELRKLLEEILPDQTTIEGYYIQHDFSKIGNRTMKLNAREIKQDAGNRRMILLAIEDVSGVDGKG